MAELITWCRILRTGPACAIPCDDCRRTSRAKALTEQAGVTTPWTLADAHAEYDMPTGAAVSGPEDALRTQVRAALDTAGISQAEAARQLDLSTKHMSQMLTGRAALTLDWADRLVALCDMRIEVLVLTGRPEPTPAEHCIHHVDIHHRHHTTPVDGCPWCAGNGTRVDNIETGGLT